MCGVVSGISTGSPAAFCHVCPKSGVFEIVEVGAPVETVRVGVVVKGRNGFLAGADADLIVSLFDGGQARPFRPFGAVRTGHEEEGAVSPGLCSA